MKKIVAAYFVLLVCGAAGLLAAPTSAEIAAAYAPVIRQQAANDKDYLAAVDFDGNWNAYDNWQHQEWGYPLKGVVYYSVFETQSHWFVSYLTSHPRRWNLINTGAWSQENDLQGVQVLVAKDGSATGKALVVETWNGSGFDRYAAATGVTPKDGRFDGAAAFEGTHPILTLSSKSHVLKAATAAAAQGKEIAYRFTGKAEEPKPNATTCGYALASVAETLWKHRTEVGPSRAYSELVNTPFGAAGAALGGDDYRANAASMPWTWADAKGGGKLAAGDWFFDPAHAFGQRYTVSTAISKAYLFNPYAAEQAPATQLASRAANFEALYGAE